MKHYGAKHYISAESVGRGHPDKICDQIADAILDDLISHDKNSRVGVEVFASNRIIVIGGEIKTNTYVDVVKIAWKVILNLGYQENDFTILSSINNQSEEITSLVEANSDDLAAGDQGIMYGYAIDETTSYMPLPISLAHAFLKKAEQVRQEGKLVQGLKSDMKSQVTLEYNGDKFKSIKSLVLALQHSKNIDNDIFREQIKQHIVFPVIEEFNKNELNFSLNGDFEILINNLGSFVIGGPIADTGLTGRKIIVDTYGGASRHGGGSFSGKDFTKVDRTGAYAARWVAKNLVAAGLAYRIEIQLAYVIGIKKPTSIFIETFGTERIDINKIYKIVEQVFDLSVQGIINHFNMSEIKYEDLAVFGHFGNDNFPWEKLDKVEQIRQAISTII